MSTSNGAHLSPRQQPGTLVLSLDTELAWGAVHRGDYAGRENHFDRTRFVVRELLALLQRYQISATWAIVGHLFLDSCSPTNGVKHPELMRIDLGQSHCDRFERDPCSNLDKDPFWYGSDIVRQIDQCSVRQEIGCHNFSHMIVDDECSKEVFASELRACREAAVEWNTTLRSFVFPRNSIGHLDVLADGGFTAFRGTTPNWASRLPRWLQRPGRFLDAFVPAGAPTALPVQEAGMWNIPASYNYLHRSGWARFVPIAVRIRKATVGLRQAARRGTVFHLWTHPFNIASDPDGLLRGLEAIFQEFARLRESGLIVNSTMGDLASRYTRQREQQRSLEPAVAGAMT